MGAITATPVAISTNSFICVRQIGWNFEKLLALPDGRGLISARFSYFQVASGLKSLGSREAHYHVAAKDLGSGRLSELN